MAGIDQGFSADLRMFRAEFTCACASCKLFVQKNQNLKKGCVLRVLVGHLSSGENSDRGANIFCQCFGCSKTMVHLTQVWVNTIYPLLSTAISQSSPLSFIAQNTSAHIVAFAIHLKER